MKSRFLNFLLIGGIVSSVMLSSCSKEDEPTPETPKDPETPDWTKDKGEFKDSRDGKTYQWVKIGDQIWMAEDLAYTGSGQQITEDSAWQNNTNNDGWCYYDNDSANGELYGVLYQWEAAKSAAPSGWHLPTDDEWAQLEDFLKQNGFSYDSIVGNDGVAKSLASDTGWAVSKNPGAVGAVDYPTFRNKTGFSALPAGIRAPNGDFMFKGELSMWWTATEEDNDKAYDRVLHFQAAKLLGSKDEKLGGSTIRCVKD